MSAITVLTYRDAVYMITDGAIVHHQTEVLTARASKIIPLPKLNAAISLRGPAGLLPIMAGVLEGMAESFDELEEKIVPGLRSQWGVWGESGNLDSAFGSFTNFDLVVAGFSERGCQPRCYMVTNWDHHGAEGVQPWVTIPLQSPFVLPATPRLLGLVQEMVRVGFDPERHATMIVEEQQSLNFPSSIWTPSRYIGGFVQFTSIHPDGITTRIVHRFRDRIGEKIEAAEAHVT